MPVTAHPVVLLAIDVFDQGVFRAHLPAVFVEVAQRFEFQFGQTLDGSPVDLHLSRGAADDYAFRLTRLLRSLDQVVDKGVVGLRSSMDWERAVTVGSAIVFLLGQSIAE